jgi:hypothetical protein
MVDENPQASTGDAVLDRMLNGGSRGIGPF